MESLKIHDKKFSESINASAIQEAIDKIATKLNCDFKEKEVFFLAVLNGSFMFAADLLKQIDFDCRISFIKVASYIGTESTGNINQLIGINETLTGKSVIIIEDIIDSGNTLNVILNELRKHQPTEIKIVSLLFKPDSFEYKFKIDYVGFRIPNEFVVGFGLDYDGLGRNLTSIYTVVEES
jgi:hypoxanthine phosphoribosyltransferase